MRAIAILVFLASTILTRAEPGLVRIYLPSIYVSSCPEICGYCVDGPLDHAMGC